MKTQTFIDKLNSADGSTRRGEQKAATAFLEMPGLNNIVESYRARQPLSGVAVLGCVTLTPQTAVFVLALRALGAKTSWCSDNRFASDSDVIAYLRASGLQVFAEPNMTPERYYECMRLALKEVEDLPHVQIHDDGCDITKYLANNHSRFMSRVSGITEQTTCGITFLNHLYREGKVSCPSIDVAHGLMKGFDNFFGVQQSLVQALTTIGITIASTTVAIIGYGKVGEGAAKQLRSLGASVGVVECDIVRLAKAYFDGFQPMSIEQALTSADLVLSASGCLLTVDGEMLQRFAKDGIVLGNIGHGQEEIDIEWLATHCTREDINVHRAAYILPDGRTVHLLCEGALINFLAGTANPSRELSLTFTASTLAQMTLAAARKQNLPLSTKIHTLSRQIEEECARLNFPGLLSKLYCLSNRQQDYLGLTHVQSEVAQYETASL